MNDMNLLDNIFTRTGVVGKTVVSEHLVAQCIIVH